MFTGIAAAAVVATFWYADRCNIKDRAQYDRRPPDEQLLVVTLHARQDLKLIAFLLGGILLMLGIIADAR